MKNFYHKFEMKKIQKKGDTSCMMSTYIKEIDVMNNCSSVCVCIYIYIYIYIFCSYNIYYN